MTAAIILENIVLDYPVYGAATRDLRNRLVAVATAGRVSTGEGLTTVRALDHVSLAVSHGERIGLVGRNGAGKTSLLRVIAGVLQPTAGTVLVRGAVRPLLNIGVGVHPDLTGREVAALRLELDGVQGSALPAAVEEVVAFAELREEFAALPVRTYSTGMLTRLLFSIATHRRAEILVLDEWLTVMDTTFAAKAEARMREVVEAAGILVLASHSRELMARWCQRGYRLEQGRLEAVAQF